MRTKNRSQIGICHRAPLLSEGLARTLARLHSAEASRLECEAILGSEAKRFPALDLLVLDSLLVGDDASRVRRLLETRLPRCKLLLVVPDPCPQDRAALIELQAHAWVSEAAAADEMLTAVRAVLAGQSHVCSVLAERLLLRPADCAPPKPGGDDRLTPRERQVLELIGAERLTNKQLARRLHLSVCTIKNHVQNILKKLPAARGRHEAADLTRGPGLSALRSAPD